MHNALRGGGRGVGLKTEVLVDFEQKVMEVIQVPISIVMKINMAHR